MTALRLKVHWRPPGGDPTGFALSVDTELPATTISAIYGPSGSGKTTLLRCIAGLEPPSRGSEISLGKLRWCGAGPPTPSWLRRVGVVFQDARLFPHLTVEANLGFAARSAWPEDIVTALDLAPLLGRHPHELSAGQRQRVALARSLFAEPRLLLLDEPFANLDRESRQRCARCLRRIHEQRGLPMVYVSHDLREIAGLADHLVLLRDGAIEAAGPLLALTGALHTPLTREFGALTVLEAEVRAHDDRYGLSELAVDGQSLLLPRIGTGPGERHRLCVAARDVSVCREDPADSSILNRLRVELRELQPLGDAHCTLRLALGSTYLLAHVTRRSVDALGLRVGDSLIAQVKSVALLDAAPEDRLTDA